MQEEKKVQRCTKCGFRIRGKNHEDGPHHKGTMRKVARK